MNSGNILQNQMLNLLLFSIHYKKITYVDQIKIVDDFLWNSNNIIVLISLAFIQTDLNHI